MIVVPILLPFFGQIHTLYDFLLKGFAKNFNGAVPAGSHLPAQHFMIRRDAALFLHTGFVGFGYILTAPCRVFIPGIAKRIAEICLARPNHVVIGSVRDLKLADVDELQALYPGGGSKLYLVHIDNTSPDDAAQAVAEMEAAGLDHIDTVIANEGACPFPVLPIETIPNADLVTAFQTNAASVLGLFQAVRHLLKKSKDPRFAVFSSPGSSISLIAGDEVVDCDSLWHLQSGTEFHCTVSVLQTIVRRTDWPTADNLRCLTFSQQDWLTVIATTPGNTQTVPGNWIARQIGREQAALTIDESAHATLRTVESTSRKDALGRLIDAQSGETIPW
ncbi:NAD(P)-binding protein [Paramyrothecium foliicola]|nr:NAD(P)-binding protein [Paramyrothecium foliicola]